MKIVIPMAGRGSRFQAAVNANPEYKKPKPIINIKGKPMVRWAIDSLKPVTTQFKVTASDLIFVCLQEHQDKFAIADVLKQYFSPQIKVVLIPRVTRGAVETVMAAKRFIAEDQDLIISDSDHYFNGANLYKAILGKEPDVAGIIPVFLPPDDEIKWSYTLFDKNHTAIAVGEKDPDLAAKGAYANIGSYYFSKGKTFIDEANEMINQNETYGPAGKQEFFVAPMYQRLIKKGMKVKAAVIPRVWGLGTPKDLQFFLDNYH